MSAHIGIRDRATTHHVHDEKFRMTAITTVRKAPWV
jgi:hypothetical protein